MTEGISRAFVPLAAPTGQGQPSEGGSFVVEPEMGDILPQVSVERLQNPTMSSSLSPIISEVESLPGQVQEIACRSYVTIVTTLSGGARWAR